MGERTALLFFLILATQLRLGAAQVLRIGERNSCLRTESACLEHLCLSQSRLSFFTGSNLVSQARVKSKSKIFFVISKTYVLFLKLFK